MAKVTDTTVSYREWLNNIINDVDIMSGTEISGDMIVDPGLHAQLQIVSYSLEPVFMYNSNGQGCLRTVFETLEDVIETLADKNIVLFRFIKRTLYTVFDEKKMESIRLEEPISKYILEYGIIDD